MMSEANVLDWLKQHGMKTQIINEQIQALDFWSERDEKGHIRFGSEWINVTYDLKWLRDWMGY